MGMTIKGRKTVTKLSINGQSAFIYLDYEHGPYMIIDAPGDFKIDRVTSSEVLEYEANKITSKQNRKRNQFLSSIATAKQ